MVRPKYPKEALKAGTEGSVELKAVIGADGKTHDLTVIKGIPIFAPSTLDAVRKWRFHPAVVRGAPVETTYKVEMKYELILQEAIPSVVLESPQPIAPAPPEPAGHVQSTLEGPVYRVSKAAGVIAPEVIYQVDPEFSEEARKANESGTVEIALVVGTDGAPRNLRILCSGWSSLNENALSAVKRWKFKPGTKDGQPVMVEVQVEVEFKLNN
jgi:TonB family protein